MNATKKEFLGRGWTFPPRVDAAGRIALSEQEDDIREAIPLILLTARGERPMRPEFGGGLHDAVFTTLSATNLGRLQAEIRRALLRWEPRIEVLEVAVKPGAGQVGTLLVDVDYRVRATNNRFNLVFPFYLDEGS
ncbi:MAG: GPW/gp25 family protein [Acidobacteriota bacterium]|jgi:phage baseplate assembly protein W